MEITQERIMELWRKTGSGHATLDEIKEWMDYRHQRDNTQVVNGQVWRNKGTRELARVVATTNRYGQVGVVYIGRHEGMRDDVDDSFFHRAFEYVQSLTPKAKNQDRYQAEELPDGLYGIRDTVAGKMIGYPNATHPIGLRVEANAVLMASTMTKRGATMHSEDWDDEDAAEADRAAVAAGRLCPRCEREKEPGQPCDWCDQRD